MLVSQCDIGFDTTRRHTLYRSPCLLLVGRENRPLLLTPAMHMHVPPRMALQDLNGEVLFLFIMGADPHQDTSVPYLVLIIVFVVLPDTSG
jgi:hypothetical protein